MHVYAKPVILLAIAAMAYLGSVVNYRWTEVNAYHGPHEINFFRGNGITLPLSDNGYFMGSGKCDGCHGFDETQHANVNELGHDISPITMWRASMMANSAKDPFWRAKVSHEVTVNPQHQEALEDKCTSCHAPMGRYSHVEFNLGSYGISDLENDSLGLDGVSCLACHKQSPQGLGSNHSGDLNFIGAPVAFGPFEKPFEPPMQELVGLAPTYGEHINDAGICAGCHTLLTNSVDLNGNFTGQTFVEQATYHEWLNSAYDDGQSNATTCQGCHMPRIDEGVVISANYLILFPRQPYAKHELVGGNSFMLKLMKNNISSLGIAATEEHFDSTIARTENMLKHQTMNLDLDLMTFDNDTAYFEVRLENLAGHKFPSGYPARRAFLEFVVLTQTGDTLFKSGVLNPSYGINGQNADFEPHYNIIKAEDQAQIYELVMGDVNGNVTTVLERAFQPLKDNRLAPLGFSTLHSVYDTTMIVGNATVDPDFNFDGFEGSGTDVVHYHVGLNGYNGTLKVVSRVYYQSAPRKWMQEMFSHTTTAINTFKAMYDNADHTPVLVAADSIMNISVVTSVPNRGSEFAVYPNPTTDGVVKITGTGKVDAVKVYTLSGKLVANYARIPSKGIELPKSAGVYYVRIESTRSSVFRIVRL